MAILNAIVIGGGYILLFLLVSVQISYAADAVQIGNASIGGMQVMGTDPCDGTPAIGTACSRGTLYAGSWNGYKYMTTPGGCSNWVDSTHIFTPSCPGTTDSVTKAWANNSGTTAYNVVTGASSTTDGKSNTTTLIAYTDTDAARYCSNNRFGWYNDWYLPAASLANDANGELYNVLYVNRVALGGFQSSSYWSSTETTATTARLVVFSVPVQGNNGKTLNFYVRCVRRY